MNWDEPVLSDNEEDTNTNIKSSAVDQIKGTGDKPSKLKHLLNDNKPVTTKPKGKNYNNNNTGNTGNKKPDNKGGDNLYKPTFKNNNKVNNNDKPLNEKAETSNNQKKEDIAKPSFTGNMKVDKNQYVKVEKNELKKEEKKEEKKVENKTENKEEDNIKKPEFTIKNTGKMLDLNVNEDVR